ncbi:energy transducer TonB [Ulvibacterium marinum]|uniref:Energy transducer TonB n=1 Tax=Ulvibacterium marinum TaxID=2419782 RepID=A0A3B0C064_9FLAO|nr:energy transducer TonB [Ulvibacterium marinum]RKN78790.1 energy transducer TonB [Ulvibacterium marinum]
MKPKKNPKIDLNKDRAMYFVAGLTLVLLITYVALEWKSYDTIDYVSTGMNVENELIEEVPLTVHFTPPPPPPPIAPPVIEIVNNKVDIIETEIMSDETNQDTQVMEVKEIEVAEVEEDVTVPFILIEDVPIFPGCENASDKRACFQKMMQKHINKTFQYPKLAKELEIEGRVHTMFVIQKDGSIGDIKMRGPDKILEVEAARIIGKLPKMTPGKQRGNPVKVPFVVPITFKLR